MKQLPDNVTPCKRTREFTEESVPSGLLHAHQAKESVWTKIVVLEGELQSTINGPDTEVEVLNSSTSGVVEPTYLHEVKPLGKVRLLQGGSP